MATLDKYHKQDTAYEEGDAEYDAAGFNFIIADDSDDIIALFPDAETRDRVLKLLNESEGPTQGHADRE